MVPHWYGVFDKNADPKIRMEYEIFTSRIKAREYCEDNLNGIIIEEPLKAGDSVYVGMVYSFDKKRDWTYTLDDNSETFIENFVYEMFDKIEHFISENISPYYDYSEYLELLAKHNLSMCESEESLIEYFMEHDYLEVNINGKITIVLWQYADIEDPCY